LLPSPQAFLACHGLMRFGSCVYTRVAMGWISVARNNVTGSAQRSPLNINDINFNIEKANLNLSSLFSQLTLEASQSNT
jgi:hypothetical protein